MSYRVPDDLRKYINSKGKYSPEYTMARYEYNLYFPVNKTNPTIALDVKKSYDMGGEL